jgi:hypothetical protein
MSRGRRFRKWLVGLLVVLTSLGVVASTVAVWARSTIFDSDKWAELSGQIIRNPDVIEGVGIRLSTGIVEGLDVQERIETALAGVEQLPPQAGLLAAPLTEGLRQRLEARIVQVLRTPEVQRLWVRASRNAHAAIVRVLRGETRPGVTIEAGKVTLNLLPLINRALAATQDLISGLLGRPIDVPTAEEIAATGTPDRARQLLEERLGLDLPDNLGRMVVFSSDRLAAAQDAVRLLDTFVVLIIVLTLVFLAAALVLSVARRRTLLQLACGVLIGALVARLIVREVEEAIVGLSSERLRGAVIDVVGDVFVGLVNLTTILLVAGIIVGVGAYLAGRPAWLGRVGEKVRSGPLPEAATRTGAWVQAHLNALRFAGILVAVLILFVIDLSWASALITLVALATLEIGLTYAQNRARTARSGPIRDV